MSDRKHRTPMGVGEALAGYLKRSGLEPRVSQAGVIPDWAALVGPQIAAVTTPDRVSPDGILFVGVRTSAWMTELQLMAPEIMARVNAGRGTGRLKTIRWFLSP